MLAEAYAGLPLKAWQADQYWSKFQYLPITQTSAESVEIAKQRSGYVLCNRKTLFGSVDCIADRLRRLKEIALISSSE